MSTAETTPQDPAAADVVEPTLAAVAKGASIGSRRIELTRADLVAYAAASGDHNPIHWSESFATSVGLPGVIAHGMLTMGAAVQLVTDWAGDPGAVVDYQTRFTSMVPVADTTGQTDEAGRPLAGALLDVAGKIGAVDAEAGTARVDLTVTVASQDGARALTKAQAVVRLGAGA